MGFEVEEDVMRIPSNKRVRRRGGGGGGGKSGHLC